MIKEKYHCFAWFSYLYDVDDERQILSIFMIKF